MFRSFHGAALAAAIATSCPAFAQTATGDWHGVIARAPIGDIRLDLVIEESAAGMLSGKIAAPDQGAPATPLSDVKREGGTLSFSVPATRASFSGAWDATANAWVGTYRHPAGDSPTRFEPGLSPSLPPLPPVTGLDGRWEGKLQGVAPLVIRIETSAAGTSALMDSPAQQSANIPLRTLTLDGATVTFSIPAMMVTFEGQLSGETLDGAFIQGGRSVPLTFTRTASTPTRASISARPQTPKPPFPYTAQDVAFDTLLSPGVRLRCTLTTPPGPPAPVAILLSGSGPQDRNADVLGHQTFAVLADHLARNGIAALRCDDRDWGKPPEYGFAQTLGDYAADARAALAFLRTRTDIDPAAVGYIGHSLGGVIAPVAASEEPDIAFVVMLAGLGVTGVEAALEQRVSLAEGATPAEIAEIRSLWPRVLQQLAGATDPAVASALIRDALTKTPKARPPIYPTVDFAVQGMASAYARSLSAYDPAPYFQKVDAPILALYGERDVQVAAEPNLDALRRITVGKDATLLKLPGLNHAFQHARTGAMNEYADIEETFAPEALSLISDWIAAKVGR